MPVYSTAPSDVRAFVDEVMHGYCPDLVKAGVTIGILMVHPTDAEDKADKAPLRLGGYPCAATIQKTPYEKRVQGVEDAVMKIDARRWRTLSDDERTALVHHELHHVVPIRGKADDEFKTDDAGRPKIKMRLHDLVLGGFTEIIRRHGIAAIEAQQIRDIFGAYRQEVFAWSDDNAAQDEMPDVIGAVA